MAINKTIFLNIATFLPTVTVFFSIKCCEQALVLETTDFSQPAVVDKIQKLRILENGDVALLQENGQWVRIAPENSTLSKHLQPEQLEKYLLSCYFTVKQFTDRTGYTVTSNVRGLGGGNSTSKAGKRVVTIKDPLQTVSKEALKGINEWVKKYGLDGALFLYSMEVCYRDEKYLKHVELLLTHGAALTSLSYIPEGKDFDDNWRGYFQPWQPMIRSYSLGENILVCKQVNFSLIKLLMQHAGEALTQVMINRLAGLVYLAPQRVIFCGLIQQRRDLAARVNLDPIFTEIEKISSSLQSNNGTRSQAELNNCVEAVRTLLKADVKPSDRQREVLMRLKIPDLLLAVAPATAVVFNMPLNFELIKGALDKGMDINVRNSAQDTLLYFCLWQNPINFQVAFLLISRGVDVNATNATNSVSSLSCAIRAYANGIRENKGRVPDEAQANYVKLIQLLRERKAKFDEKDSEARVDDLLEIDDLALMVHYLPTSEVLKHPLVLRAAKQGDETLVQTLISRGVRPTNVAYIEAVKAKNVGLIILLLNAGLDPNVVDFNSYMGLPMDAIRFIIGRGGRPSNAALVAAVKTKNVDLILLFLSAGVDPNALDVNDYVYLSPDIKSLLPQRSLEGSDLLIIARELAERTLNKISTDITKKLADASLRGKLKVSIEAALISSNVIFSISDDRGLLQTLARLLKGETSYDTGSLSIPANGLVNVMVSALNTILHKDEFLNEQQMSLNMQQQIVQALTTEFDDWKAQVELSKAETKLKKEQELQEWWKAQEKEKKKQEQLAKEQAERERIEIDRRVDEKIRQEKKEKERERLEEEKVRQLQQLNAQIHAINHGYGW